MGIFPCDGTVADRREREESEDRKMTHLYEEAGGKSDLKPRLAHFVLLDRPDSITKISGL